MLLDGWSAASVLKDLIRLYEIDRSGKHADLPSISTYGEYLAWLDRQSSKEVNDFWNDYLWGFKVPNSIALLRADGSNDLGTNRVRQVVLESDSPSRQIEHTASSMQVTSAAVVYAAWAILLSAICDSDDVVFGNTSSGRSFELSGSTSMAGCFTNVVPIRCRVKPQQTVAQLA